jgi:drug/metabolite transporter, DME family
MKTDPKLGVAMVLGAAAMWGTTGTANTFASDTLSSVWFGALRLVVASAFFAVYAWYAQRGAAPHTANSPAWAGVVGAGLCMTVYNLSFFGGVRLTGVAIGTAVALGSGPLWAGILQSLISRSVPAASWWLGTAVAVTGGVLMTASGGTGQSPISVAGIALCLTAGLSYAVYSLINKDLVQSASAATVTFRVFTVAAVFALPAAWIEGGAPVIVARDWWPVLYVGVVTAGIAYLLFSYALRHISAATGVTLALGEPVMAFMLAVLVVGEKPSAYAFVGLALVVAGVLVVVRAELRSGAETALPESVKG